MCYLDFVLSLHASADRAVDAVRNAANGFSQLFDTIVTSDASYNLANASEVLQANHRCYEAIVTFAVCKSQFVLEKESRRLN